MGNDERRRLGTRQEAKGRKGKGDIGGEEKGGGKGERGEEGERGG